MQINVIPKNGLANRLRAMASAHLLAKSLGMRAGLYWKTERIFPANLVDLFNLRGLEKAYDAIGDYFSRFQDKDFEALIKVESELGQVYVNSRRLGETTLLPSIIGIMDFACRSTEFSFYAGGLFHECMTSHCLDCPTFRSKRQQFYKLITNETYCEQEAINFLRSNSQEYIAVHLRKTEMQNEQVSYDVLCGELLNLPQIVSGRTRFVFLSGDDLPGVEEFARLVERIGLVPFWRESVNLQRSKVLGTRDALVDFILLSKSQAIVRSGPTTFSYEAAVLGGIFDSSRHLNRKAKGIGVMGSSNSQKLNVNQ